MKKILGIFGLITMMACSPVHAGSSVVWGKVTNVKPVYTNVVNQTPQQVCKQVQVPVYGNNGQTNNGNAILGAIIGGVLIGVLEKIFEIYWGQPLLGGNTETWFAFMLALIILIFKPQGLFGEKIIERV